MNSPLLNPLPQAGEEANVKIISLNDAHTFDLAQAAAAASSMTAVAVAVGYSRTAISLYLSGKYGAGVEKLEAAIRARYDIYRCTHTGHEISGPQCQGRATAPRPFGGRAKEAHWLACQGCAQNKGRVT